MREKQRQQSGMASDQLSGVHDTSVSVSEGAQHGVGSCSDTLGLQSDLPYLFSDHCRCINVYDGAMTLKLGIICIINHMLMSIFFIQTKQNKKREIRNF